MKTTLKLLGTVLLGAALFLPSCSKDESITGNLSYQINPANFTASVGTSVIGSGLVVNVSSKSSLTWTSGAMFVSEIDFEAENNSIEIEHELKNMFSIDLLNLSSVLGSITIPPATYEEVELKLVVKPSSTQTPVTLKGEYTNANSSKIPVEFYFNEEFEIEVEAENITVDQSNDYLGLINLQLNKLLLNVSSSDLDQASKTNGTIVISATSNVSLYNKLKASLNAFGNCDFED